jgi:hypothetical protein
VHRIVKLESGHEVEAFWTRLDGRYVITELVLWRDGLKLGTLVQRDPGKYGLAHNVNARQAKLDDKVIAYYLAKHPDLAGEDQKTVLEKGFAREVDLALVFDRFEDMFKAMSQISEDGQYLFLVIDAEGRIYTWDERAAEACYRAMSKGWEGWFSPDRADEDTLRVVPASKVRARVDG